VGRIRVIVAQGTEGSASPSGLLRAILEREGVEVAGEVLTPFELIQLAADEQPDAVVFATRAPQAELDRLRAVAPSSKIVFVSPILTAAEAEMAEAVVERADVLASLGPVLVHLCAPGRINARRAMTEGFDRPDWIDRIRKDPVTLREILTDGMAEETPERPSVTSLQGEARAADRSALAPLDDDVVRLPDLEAEAAEPRLRRRDDLPAGSRPEGGRRRRLRLWSFTLAAASLIGLWLLPATLPVALVRVANPPLLSVPGDDGAAEPGGEEPRPRRRDPGPHEPDARASRDRGAAATTAGGGVAGDGLAGDLGGGDQGGDAHGPNDPGVGPSEMPGASAEHNPHGAPPGQSGEHPVPGEPQLPR
jgi:hypothetical protein